MPLEPGTKLGSYEILEQIGQTGEVGASEVYRASDPRANQTVAIKVLAESFSKDSESMQRFEREVQTIARLNHPHICAWFHVGHQDGINYVVMEYLEGETLAERLKRGAFELDETLKVAIAIADALDKAHRQGVIHRSLRPSNVMLSASGPKLLDFGLSKLMSPSGSLGSLTSLPTRTTDSAPVAAATGALQYTAPEQIEGHDADARTDIFAFGAILYEMATGRKAFEGKTEPLLISAITSTEPKSLLKAQPMAPPALDHVVRRCLAKDPRQRLQTAWDLMGQLQWIAEGGSQIGIPAVVAAHRKKREKWVWATAAVVLVLALAFAVPAFRYLQGPPQAEETRFLESVANAPIIGSFFVSPDGRWIAIWGLDVNAPTGPTLFVRPTGSVTPQRLTFIEGLNVPVISYSFWSADSKSIAFFAEGRLKKVDVAGGPSQTICDAALPVGGGTWNQNGTIVFSSANKLYRVLAAGGQPSEIAAPDSSQHETGYRLPYFLPDGNHYLYQAVSSEASKTAIYVGSLDSKERKRVVESEFQALYAAPGYLLFDRGGTLFAQPFNPKKLTVTGEAVLIADQIATISQTGVAEFSVSQNGALTFRTNTGAQGSRGRGAVLNNVLDRPLRWLDRSGKQIEQVGTPGPYLGVDVSPDGKRIAVHRHEGEGGDIFIFERGTMTRFTFDATQDNSSPVWSPDGARIAFASRRNSKWGLYMKLADNTAKEEPILESEAQVSPMSWSPDGKFLVYRITTGPAQSADQWAVPLTGDKKPVPILQTPFGEQNPQVSPDGKWIAYSSNQTANTYQIYIKPFPNGPAQWQVSMEGGFFPRWRRDGKELYFMSAAGGGNVMVSEIHVDGSSVQPGVPRMLFPSGYGNSGHPALPPFSYNAYDVSPDGRVLMPQAGVVAGAGDTANFIATVADRGGLAAFIASQQPGNNPANPITVVLNWTGVLKK